MEDSNCKFMASERKLSSWRAADVSLLVGNEFNGQGRAAGERGPSFAHEEE